MLMFADGASFAEISDGISSATGLTLYDPVLDGGLNTFASCNGIIVCSQVPATYAEALAAAIGSKSFAPGTAFGATGAATPGRKLTSAPITDGDITANGTPVCWVAVDASAPRLLASGPLTAPASASAGQKFSLDAFTIKQPGV